MQHSNLHVNVHDGNGRIILFDTLKEVMYTFYTYTMRVYVLDTHIDRHIHDGNGHTILVGTSVT